MKLLHFRGLFIIVLLYVSLASISRALTQPTDFKFDHLTTNDGLPSGDVNDLIQDQRGFIWFCTWDGLVRYDGYNFISYKPDLQDSSTLSSKLVYCITEDPSGGLWVGTKNGLNYFDRKKESFRRYMHKTDDPQSLLSNWVIDIAVDQRGNLCIATDQGLSRISLDENREPLKYQHYQADINKPNSLPDKQVLSLMVDKNNNLWAGTLHGLAVIDAEGKLSPINTFGGKEQLANITITSLYQDKEENIWIGTKGGKVYQWNQENHILKTFNDAKPDVLESNKYVSDFCEDELGNMWFSVFEGGIYVKKSTGDFQRIQHHSKISTSLKSNQVKSLFKDRSGVLWIGLAGQGADKLNLYSKAFDHYFHQSDNPQSLNFNTVMSFAQDPLGCMWIGTKEGLNIFYPDKNKFVHYENQAGTRNPLITKKIWSLYGDPDEGYMWIGGHYGLTVVNLKKSLKTGEHPWISGDFSPYSKHILLSNPELEAEKHQVRAIYRDRRGSLWVGTYDGLFELKTAGDSVSIVHHYTHDPMNPNSLSDNICISIIEDSKGDMWVGTRDGGLNRLVRNQGPNEGKFIRYMAKAGDFNSLSNNEVASIHEDKEGNIWIGTAGGGLNKLERNVEAMQGEQASVFTHFSEKEGLLADDVFGILEDEKENLWLSTNQGLFKFNPKLPKEQQFKQFTKDHGLQSNMFFTGAFYKCRTNKMYFGGQNGFNIFHPDSIKENVHLPQVLITELEIFNKRVKVGEKEEARDVLQHPISESEEIYLSYKASNFSLSFAALHYSSPENNKYAYKLEGYDEDWIYTDANRRYASYNNLKPGSYIFKVKASNSDDIWNEQYTQLIIHTSTPPWKSWWAIMLYGLCLLSFLFAFRYYTLNKIRLENDLELQRLAHKKSEEVNRIKLQFFTQISHEFRTPLTLIIGPIQELIEKGRNLSWGEMNQHLKSVEFNSSHLLRLIEQLLYFSKSEQGQMKFNPQQGDLVEFLQQLCDSFGYMAGKKGILLDLDTQSEEIILNLDWDKMEKILNNLLSNALKFTEPKGKITLRAYLSNLSEKQEAPEVIIEVKDTGIGIPAKHLSMIFDSFYQASPNSNNAPTGYGIGLALSKKLVEIHKGKIDVKSEEGRGTCFTIHLPYHSAKLPIAYDLGISAGFANNEDLYGFEELNAYAEKSSLGRPLKVFDHLESKLVVLVVDDNPKIRSYVSENLGSSYDVLEAENGQEAWLIAQQSIPTVIISDIMMPEMDGIELCMLIKSDERTNHIPVILLTAKSEIEHRIEGLEAGADAYLPKPFNPRLLQVRVQQLIELREKLRNKFLDKMNELPEQNPLLTEEDEFLQKVIHIIESCFSDTDFTVGQLEYELGMSHMQLYRKLKALTNQSANEFIRTVRLNKAAHLLHTTSLNVSEVAYQVGFNSPSYFIKCFRKQFGVLPKVYASDSKKLYQG